MLKTNPVWGNDVCKGAWVLKHNAKIAILAGVATVLVTSPVLAESVERPLKTRDGPKISSFSDFVSSFGPKKPETVAPAAPVAKHPKIADTPKPAKVKKQRKPRKAVVRKKKPSVAVATKKRPAQKADWWETVGNPAVFAFRDCSVKFAKSQVDVAETTTPANVITSAMKTSCQVEFAKMAGVLIGGLGEKRSNAMLTELARTTFLPPVKIALQEQRIKQITIAARTTSTANLEAAKADMFQCFSERTDRLTIAKNTQANTIADAVLAGCRAKSDAFFDLLFAGSKASPQVKQQQKNIALNETYKIAIVRRVLATRKPSQVKTAIQQ